MEKLVKTLVLLVVLVVAIKEGLPWIQEHLGSTPIATLAPGTIPEPAAGCLQALRTVRGELEATRSILSNRRERVAAFESSFSRAREECNCRPTACRKAGQALDLIGEVAGSSTDPGTLARIDALILEARKLAREGS